MRVSLLAVAAIATEMASAALLPPLRFVGQPGNASDPSYIAYSGIQSYHGISPWSEAAIEGLQLPQFSE